MPLLLFLACLGAQAACRGAAAGLAIVSARELRGADADAAAKDEGGVGNDAAASQFDTLLSLVRRRVNSTNQHEFQDFLRSLKLRMLTSTDAVDRALTAAAFVDSSRSSADAMQPAALDALLAALGQEDPHQPADRVASRPMARRLVMAALVHWLTQVRDAAVAGSSSRGLC